jgi:hypothetical protein
MFQRMPDSFNRWPMTALQPSSTVPEPMNRPTLAERLPAALTPTPDTGTADPIQAYANPHEACPINYTHVVLTERYCGLNLG